MINKVKDVSIENHAYYVFHDIINRNNLDPNNNKRDENSSKNIFIYYIGYVRMKDSKYVKKDIVNPLCLFIKKVNG